MTVAGARIDVGAPVATGRSLVAGIVLACLTDAIASTILAHGRADIIGDTYATPDEFAWLDVGYTAFNMSDFVFAPWLLTRVDPRRLFVIATMVMSADCASPCATAVLHVLVFLPKAQGHRGA